MDAILAFDQQQAEEEQQERLAERIADMVAERISGGIVQITKSTADSASAPDAEAMDKNMQYMEDFLSSWA